MAEPRGRSSQEREAARRERAHLRGLRTQDELHERDLHEPVGHRADPLDGPHERSLEWRREQPPEWQQARLGLGSEDDYEEDEYIMDEDGELGEDEEYEVPSGTRRVARFAHLDRARRSDSRARESETSASGARDSEVSGEPRRPARRRSRWVGRAFALFALIAGVALIWFLVELLQPFHGHGQGSVTVTIPARTSSGEIGTLLERDGVISSSFFFKLRATLQGDRDNLRSGTYRLKRDMSYSDVLKVLTTPPPPAKVSELTLIPGKTRAQTDALLRAQGIAGSYRLATRRSAILDPAAYGAPRSTPSLEGFLFPDTYQLRDPISVGALVADQLRAFRQQFATVGLGYARRKHLTPYDVLIIASMVEGEAQVVGDRALVASVIYNRLKRSMPLQLDATTRYATGNYDHPLTKAQVNSRSPYNTRIHKGLPPTPIDSPSLASIQAAAHPAQTKDLYFVVKVCGRGRLVFASSYSRFESDAAAYARARAKRGGRSPEFC